MPDDLNLLPPPEKKVVAQELVKAKYSSRTIEDWVGVDHATICRWALEDTDEEMRQYATDFRKQLDAFKMQGLALGAKRITELLPKERRLDQVVKTMEYLEGKEQGTTNINMMKLEIIQDASETI